MWPHADIDAVLGVWKLDGEWAGKLPELELIVWGFNLSLLGGHQGLAVTSFSRG